MSDKERAIKTCREGGNSLCPICDGYRTDLRVAYLRGWL